jgi:MarR-like DNA-binding transcriptional regulator SgrR of sgrS sRNA
MENRKSKILKTSKRLDQKNKIIRQAIMFTHVVVQTPETFDSSHDSKDCQTATLCCSMVGVFSKEETKTMAETLMKEHARDRVTLSFLQYVLKNVLNSKKRKGRVAVSAGFYKALELAIFDTLTLLKCASLSKEKMVDHVESILFEGWLSGYIDSSSSSPSFSATMACDRIWVLSLENPSKDGIEE